MIPLQSPGLVEDEREGLKLVFQGSYWLKRGDLACDTHDNMYIPVGPDIDVACNVHMSHDLHRNDRSTICKRHQKLPQPMKLFL